MRITLLEGSYTSKFDTVKSVRQTRQRHFLPAPRSVYSALQSPVVWLLASRSK